MNKRFFIYFSYKGTAYHGWQFQPNGISVQEVLTNALNTILRAEIELTGAGRTDTGVHAKLMVAHFDFENQMPSNIDFVSKLNSFLPNDISVSKIVNVHPKAHARFDAVSRKYEYHVITKKNVFKKELTTRVPEDMDFELMNKAAENLLNYTDFTSFSKLHTDVKTNNCKISHANWTEQAAEWVFTIQADRFLRNMVRAIVGTLFEVGRHKMTIDEFCQVIEAQNRGKAGVSVPARGLFLVDIQYPKSIFPAEN